MFNIMRTGQGQALAKFLKGTVGQNIFSLSVAQAVNYVIPMVLVPYLGRVLGSRTWGEVVFTQSYSAWLALIIAYGFRLSAVRQIAATCRVNTGHRYTPKIGEVASAVLGAQLLLGLFSVPLVAMSFLLIPFFRDHVWYLLVAWLLSFAVGMTPTWYFEGVQRIKLMALITLVTSVISAIVVILLVHDENQALNVLVVQSIFAIANIVILLSIMNSWTSLSIPSMSAIRDAFGQGHRIFVFRLFESLYSDTNVLLVGIATGNSVFVSFYALSEKITRACVSLINTATTAVFPVVVNFRQTDERRAKRTAFINLIFVASVGIFSCVLIFVFAPEIIDLLLGPAYAHAVVPLRIMSAVVILMPVANSLGLHWLIPWGLDKHLSKIAVSASLLNTGLILVMGSRFGVAGITTVVVMIQAIIILRLASVIVRTPPAT
ncbi:MAG: oligosaccharide flippase family protein [Bacilli bacterium]